MGLILLLCGIFLVGLVGCGAGSNVLPEPPPSADQPAGITPMPTQPTVTTANYLGLAQSRSFSGAFKITVNSDGSPGSLTPLTTLVQPSSWSTSTLYGLDYNSGTLFKYDPVKKTQTILHTFPTGASDGSKPVGNLIQTSDGTLWGMTQTGGTYGLGTIFQYNPSSNGYLLKFSFIQATGASPQGSLLLNGGKLYGLTPYGGLQGSGALFAFDPNLGSYQDLYDFDGLNGSNPFGSLTVHSDGLLYGLTYTGGANLEGVLFSYDTSTNQYTKKYDFNQTTCGSYPKGSLVLDSNSNLYATTYLGGVNSLGALVQLNPSNSPVSCITAHDFQSGSGYYPSGLLGSNSNSIFGSTSAGGANDQGVLFSYPIGGTYTSIYDWSSNSPAGSLFGPN